MTVSGYHEPEPGIFIPKSFQSRSSSAPEYVRNTVIRDVQVNIPIPESELAFRFPEGILVGDASSDHFYKWGNGEPAKTFNSAAEVNGWRDKERLEAMKMLRAIDPNQAWRWDYVAYGVATLALFVLLALRYRRTAQTDGR